MEKFWLFSSLEKSEKSFFELLLWKKKIVSRLILLTCIFIIFYSRLIINFTFIVLSIIVSVFDLGMSFVKVKDRKKSGNLY